MPAPFLQPSCHPVSDAASPLSGVFPAFHTFSIHQILPENPLFSLSHAFFPQPSVTSWPASLLFLSFFHGLGFRSASFFLQPDLVHSDPQLQSYRLPAGSGGTESRSTGRKTDSRRQSRSGRPARQAGPSGTGLQSLLSAQMECTQKPVSRLHMPGYRLLLRFSL